MNNFMSLQDDVRCCRRNNSFDKKLDGLFIVEFYIMFKQVRNFKHSVRVIFYMKVDRMIHR